MKIPEPLFAVINLIVRGVLTSPLHRLMSNSFLLIVYTGRKSGKTYTTPVRYFDDDGCIRCFTSAHVQWWRNVNAAPEVELVIAGTRAAYRGTVLERQPERTRRLLVQFLEAYPQDAVYQDIALNANGSLNEQDLDQACEVSVIVEFSPVADIGQADS